VRETSGGIFVLLGKSWSWLGGPEPTSDSGPLFYIVSKATSIITTITFTAVMTISMNRRFIATPLIDSASSKAQNKPRAKTVEKSTNPV
jgi:hypothetical protein